MDLERRPRIPWAAAVPVAILTAFAASQGLAAVYSPQAADISRSIPLPAVAWYARTSTWSDAAIRGVEVALAALLAQQSRARLIDAGWIGAAVSLVGRLPLLAFQNSHFLLPWATLGKTLSLGLLPPMLGLSVLSLLTDPIPRFKPQHHTLNLPPSSIDNEAYGVGIGLSTVLGALWSFAIDRSGFLDLVAGEALARTVPAKLAAIGDTLKPSYIMSHPTLIFPTLRAPTPSPMPELLTSTLLACTVPSLLLPFNAPIWVSPAVTWVTSFLTVTEGGLAPLLTYKAAFYTATEASFKVLIVQATLLFVTQEARRKRVVEASKKTD